MKHLLNNLINELSIKRIDKTIEIQENISHRIDLDKFSIEINIIVNGVCQATWYEFCEAIEISNKLQELYLKAISYFFVKGIDSTYTESGNITPLNITIDL
jgi:hypothetical protein